MQQNTEPKAIPFIQYNETTDQFYITDEAKQILYLLNNDLAIICIAGPYRTGKSFLLNRILGLQKAFQLGGTVQACTKGIWMWSEVLVSNGKKFLLLDTEGLGDPEKGLNYDVKIFALSILLSSGFCFNKIGVIDDHSISERFSSFKRVHTRELRAAEILRNLAKTGNGDEYNHQFGIPT